MKLKVKELGPIKHESEIELGDLTVFFGPPNTGKSTALKAIYYSLYSGSPIFDLLDPSRFSNGVIDVTFEVKGSHVKLAFTPSNRLRNRELPRGEFSLEPFSFSEFVLSRPLDMPKRNFEIPVLSFLPPRHECKRDEIEKIRKKIFKRELVDVEVEVRENSADVSLLFDGLSDKCVEAFIRSIIYDIVNGVARHIIHELTKGFWTELSRLEEISGVVYLPYYGRGDYIMTHLKMSRRRRLFLGADTIEYPSLTEDLHLTAEIDEAFLNFFSPLLPGSLKYSKERGLEYVEQNEAIPWNQVSGSVMEIVGFLLNLKKGKLILYEEPETELHERLQALMALILYALMDTNKLVITTHSQTILYTLAYMAFLKPKAEEVGEFLKRLGINDDFLAKAVEQANKKRVRFYYFHDGKVEEVSAEDVGRGIPGVTDVMDAVLEFLSSLYSSRGGKPADIEQR